jgi:flagellar biosynthetic protein FliO
MMNAFHCLLLLATSLSLAPSLAAQGIPATSGQTLAAGAIDPTPKPTRWTTQAKTLDTAPPESTQLTSSFPTLRDQADSSHSGVIEPKSTRAFSGPAITVTSSLAVVLGLFAALIWMTRRFGSRGINQAALSGEVLQSLGTAPIDPRTRVTLLRCGNRILVLAQTATGVQPLAEITDPEEVRHLTATCLGDAGRSFVSTLRSIEQEPVQPGFAGSVDPPPAARKRSRLFATA